MVLRFIWGSGSEVCSGFRVSRVWQALLPQIAGYLNPKWSEIMGKQTALWTNGFKDGRLSELGVCMRV